MATRSTIARMTPQGIESIYCHWDGYPEGVGATLNEHYRREEKIDQLMELGDLSILNEKIGWKHDFDNRTAEWCLAYGRDRGETGTQAALHTSKSEWFHVREKAGCEYGYLWNGNEWTQFNIRNEVK